MLFKNKFSWKTKMVITCAVWLSKKTCQQWNVSMSYFNKHYTYWITYLYLSTAYFISIFFRISYISFHLWRGGGWGGIFFLRTYFEKKVIPRFGMKHIGGVTKYVSVWRYSWALQAGGWLPSVMKHIGGVTKCVWVCLW